MDDRLEILPAERVNLTTATSQLVPRRARLRSQLAADLRCAVALEELTLYWQPQFEVTEGRATGVEVLARWFRSDGRVVDPSVFIPLAERTNTIAALGAWVLGEACRHACQWKSPGAKSLTLSVNVSIHQIDESFPAMVGEALKRSGFPARRLELEIAESALMSDALPHVEHFRELKQLGVRIAVDGFGGDCNLNRLSRLPIDRLKLDRSLIHRLTGRSEDSIVVRAIISFAREWGLSVSAAGVETEQQFRVLRELGCHQAQGFWLARAAPTDEVEGMLSQRHGARFTSNLFATRAIRRNSHAS